MKKISLLTLFAAMAFHFASASDFVVDGIDYGIYSADEKTLYVTWSSGSYSGDIVIPSTVEIDGQTWTVTAVGDFAFMQSDKLTSVQLPATIERLGTAAFAYSSTLTSINIPDGVRYIGDGCFNNCSGLIRLDFPARLDYLGAGAMAYTSVISAKLPSGLKEVPSQLFEECRALSSVEIPEGVTAIGFQAFQNTFALTSVVLPSTLETIGNNCFAFSGLESLHLPVNFRSYGDNAITYLSSLKRYTVDPDNEWFTSVDGVLYSKDMKTLNSFPLNCGKTDYTVSEATDSIGSYAFYGTSMTSVTLPEGLRAIGKSAFAVAESLKSVTVPGKVETIDSYGFFGCSALTDLSLGASLKSIGSSAFAYITALESVTSLNLEPPAGAVFTNEVYASATLNVPYSSVDAYAKADGWSGFKTVKGLGDSGVDLIASDGVEILVRNGAVDIECGVGIPVEIYGLDGKKVFSSSGSCKAMLTSGRAYIVRVGIEARKVMVR